MIFLPQIDDVEAPWTFNQKFDYVHLRILTGSIKDYPALVAQVYENLVPGGWIECAEFECWIRNEDDDPEGRELYKKCSSAPNIQEWIWGLKEAGEKMYVPSPPLITYMSFAVHKIILPLLT